MRRQLLFTLITATVAGSGCEGAFSPLGGGGRSLCDERNGIQVCAQREEYRPGAVIGFTVRNRTSETVHVDMCSTTFDGRTGSEQPFTEPDYNPTRQCGRDFTLDDILASMRELAAGTTLQLSLRIAPFAFQGQYRVTLWLLSAEGGLLSEEPYRSGIFDVFPSAG